MKTAARDRDRIEFGRLRQALLREGEPDRVPLFEHNIDPSIKQAFLGHPVRSLVDEVRFWARAGYDHIPIHTGARVLVRKIKSQGTVAGLPAERPSASGGEATDMTWAEEGQGLVTDWPSLNRFRWPAVEDFDLTLFSDLSSDMPKGMKVIPVMGYVFAATWMLMGFETFCMALLDDPDLVGAIFEQVGSLQLRLTKHLLDRFPCIGAVFHSDDMAYTEGTMISPRHLRQYVFPWYAQMNEISHDRNLPVILHSDGRLDTVLQDIIDCGFDGLHPIEPKAMDIVALKNDYGDRLCLLGGVDVGDVLTLGTPEDVSTEVERIVRDVAPGGGYVLGSSNTVPDYVPFENYQAMRETGLAVGGYPISI